MTHGEYYPGGDPAGTVEDEIVSVRNPGTLITDFLRAVKVPGTTFSTLNVFADALGKNNDELVRELVRRSTGAEIASLLNNAHKLKPADIALIFSVLEKIILTVASEIDGVESFALELAELLVTQHLRTFYYMLKTTNKSNQIKSALKLLISMCALGNKTISVLMTHFNFATCNFISLVSRRNTVDPQDVRTCAVHFIIAVAMFGDNAAIRVLLQAKNVVASLFPGLVVDRPNLIHLLLSTLLDRIVKNLSISKTLKIQLFNQTSLKQLTKVFQWNGIKKSEKEFVEDDNAITSSPEERSSVRDAALRFLTNLCSSVKFGIVFQDPSFGTSSKNFNHVLTELLRTLAFSSLYHRELARVLLIAAPDQIAHFLPTWKPGFTPRSSEKWIEMMRWLDLIYSDLDFATKVRKIPGKSRAPLALSFVLPTFMDRELQAAAFAEKLPVGVCLTFMEFLRHAFLRIYRISSLLSVEENKLFLDGCLEKMVSPEVVGECLTKLLVTTGESVEQINEEQVAEFILVLVLDSTILSRDLPRNILGNSDLSQAVASAKKSVVSELARITDETNSVASGSGNTIFDVDLSRTMLLKIQKYKEGHLLREGVCQFLLEITENSPTFLTAPLLEILMGAYAARLSVADQCIFEIVRRGEQTIPEIINAVTFSRFGRQALTHQQLQAKQGVSISPSLPTLREFVDALDVSVLAKTALMFPIRLPLSGFVTGQLIADDIYDPRYLLSNFAALIASPVSPINTQHFIESGCLGLVIRSLSSMDKAMRSAAGFCLRSLTVRAESLRFKGREQLLYVLDLIIRGNHAEKPWPNLWTVLLNKFFAVMFDSQNLAYQVTMEFFLVKPNLGLDAVPEFYKLFESGNVSHGKERKFILEVLRDGVGHYRDYELARKSHAWEMIMSFYASPLSNPASDILISQIFVEASRVPYVGRSLVKANGYVTWLSYKLASGDSTEAAGNLVISAGNCLKDLLAAKQRRFYDLRQLVKPLLQSVERGIALPAVESVLLFVTDLMISSPSRESVLLILTPQEIDKVLDIGMKLLKHSRRLMEPERWRTCCLKAVASVSRLKHMQENSERVPMFCMLGFLADISGIVHPNDTD